MDLFWFFPFIAVSIFLFTLPGVFFLERSKIVLTSVQKLFVGTIVGYVFFTFTSYLFLILKIDFLIIPTFIFLSLYVLKSLKLNLPKNFRFSGISLIAVVIFVIGIAGQLAVISPSGRKVNGDLLFCILNTRSLSASRVFAACRLALSGQGRV